MRSVRPARQRARCLCFLSFLGALSFNILFFSGDTGRAVLTQDKKTESGERGTSGVSSETSLQPLESAAKSPGSQPRPRAPLVPRRAHTNRSVQPPRPRSTHSVRRESGAQPHALASTEGVDVDGEPITLAERRAGRGTSPCVTAAATRRYRLKHAGEGARCEPNPRPWM